MRPGLVIYSFKDAWTDAYGLIERAAAAGLRGVEYPPDGLLPSQTPAELARARATATAHGLAVVADGGQISEADLRRWIPLAAAIGAPVLRVIISGILGGNRRQLNGGWAAQLAAATAALQATRPLAADYAVSIAVENHQDIASDELLQLCETVGGDHIGVTLDTGSTLALAEAPLAYARRVKDYVKNVHLKDYTLHLSPTGYRLARCALGAGVVDLPAIFRLFADRPTLPMNIELGAMQARHVELLEADWWRDYPPRRAQDLLGTLEIVFNQASPAAIDWRTPHERDEPLATRIAYELRQFDESVAYLRQLGCL
jgi:sugar phosphate isomerase/epimerase